MIFEMIFIFDDGSTLTFSPEDEKIVIGRGSSSSISLPVDGISRAHLSIHVQDYENILITDLGSKNGTSINGIPLNPNEPVNVKPTDKIQFGPVKRMLIKFKDQNITRIENILNGEELISSTDSSKTIAVKISKDAEKGKYQGKIELDLSHSDKKRPTPKRKVFRQPRNLNDQEKKQAPLPLGTLLVILAAAIAFILFYK
jgi:pSer/pThr/pTyr-binding forkhead associated (FHA) protein